MRPHQLEYQQINEGKDAANGRLFHGVRRDKDEYIRQEYPPATLDHLVVVHIWGWNAWTRVKNAMVLENTWRGIRVYWADETAGAWDKKVTYCCWVRNPSVRSRRT